MDRRKFDVTKWLHELGETRGSFERLEELIADQTAMSSHVDRRAPAPPSSPWEHTQQQMLDELVRHAVASGIQRAHEIHRRQMIVLCASLFEAGLRDYLEHLFVAHPSRMHKFIGPKELPGFVPLSSIADAPDKDALLAFLAQQAARRVASSTTPKLLPRIEEVSSYPLPSGFVAELRLLLEHRHRIVHELDPTPVRADSALAAFDIVENAFAYFSDSAMSNGVPSLTYQDLLEELKPSA